MPPFQKAHVEWPGGLESAFRKMELHAEHKFLPSKFFTLLSISHPVTTFIFSKIWILICGCRKFNSIFIFLDDSFDFVFEMENYQYKKMQYVFTAYRIWRALFEHGATNLSLVEGIQGVLGGPHLDLGALVNVHVAVAVLPEALGVSFWPANDQVCHFSVQLAFFHKSYWCPWTQQRHIFPLFSVFQEVWCPFDEVSFICHLGGIKFALLNN